VPVRPPLDLDRIRAGVKESSVTQVHLHEQLASTNTEAARLGMPWALVLAEHQVGGKGRLGRRWSEAPRAGLAMSVLVPTPPGALGWVPLLTGLALHQAVRAVTGLDTAIKWPNDLLAQSGAKLAGILCELTPAGIVIGAGLNVLHSRDELPVPTATSLALELGPGAAPDRTDLVIAYAGALSAVLNAQHAGGADAAGERAAYRRACTTIGARVELSDGTGRARRVEVEAVDDDGRLVVRDASGRPEHVTAGDVHHVRVAE